MEHIDNSLTSQQDASGNTFKDTAQCIAWRQASNTSLTAQETFLNEQLKHLHGHTMLLQT